MEPMRTNVQGIAIIDLFFKVQALKLSSWSSVSLTWNKLWLTDNTGCMLVSVQCRATLGPTVGGPGTWGSDSRGIGAAGPFSVSKERFQRFRPLVFHPHPKTAL